jgi:amino-acid N-acetyltransferase
LISSEPKLKTSYESGVNLGGFYGTARAVAESPKFVQQPEKQNDKTAGPQIHLALVKIRVPHTLSDETLYGVGRTISQLARLGLASVVIVDCESENGVKTDAATSRLLATEQAERLVVAIDSHGEPGARLVNNAIGISEKERDVGSAIYLRGTAHVTMRDMLITPLRRGIVPVIPSLGYTEKSQISIPVSADEVVLALTREFSGVQSVSSPEEDPVAFRERLQALQKEISLDRVIVLDPLGGIPASDRPNGYHVFLNMEQEFESAKQDLLKLGSSQTEEKVLESLSEPTKVSNIGASNPFTKFVETEFGGPQEGKSSCLEFNTITTQLHSSQHLQNLQLVRSVLLMLPPSSSALLTTPDEAANSGKQPDIPFQATGVGTRRQRNPLIHNLLTDKPVFSSSLPVGRLGPPTSTLHGTDPHSLLTKITPATFAKQGMSVTIFPDPRTTPWEPPLPGKPQLTLTDSHIDLPRLIHLIEDSFGRKLDVKDYLERVNGRVAGVIIAGEYEGGALLTWETPQVVADDGSPDSRARMVPYLDKFAVLKRSQGSGGTADVVFKAMVRECFPDGVCWRSRKSNVVNKWYFERSRGTWKLPDSGWTMFWTTPDLSLDQQKFRDYESVCRGVVPSWADNKALLD